MKRGRGGRHLYEAVAMLIGTTIGAGVLGIPYTFMKSGALVGMAYILVLGLIVLAMNLYVGEISLRTKSNHMLAGYAEKYLGKWGKGIMASAVAFGIYGALVAYLVGEGEVLSALFGNTPMFWSILFFIAFSSLLYFKLEVIAESDLLMSSIMILLMISLALFSIPHANLENLQGIDTSNLFLPYGIIFFALLGASAIPEMKAELGKRRKDLKKAIILGGAAVILLYALFALAVVSVTGFGTTELATIGLGNLLGERMLLLGNLFAAFSMGTSFLLLGLAMKWMLHYDYRLSEKASWAATLAVPLALFLLGARSFISIIGITGAVAGGIEGIMIILIAMKAKKKGQRKPEYKIPLNWAIAFFFIAVFLLGIASQFMF